MEMNLQRDSVFYAIVTFVSSWTCWGMLITLNLPVKSTWYSMTLYLLGGFATAIVALLLPLFRDREEKREYYRRFFHFQIPLSQYLLSVIIPLAMGGVSYFSVYFFDRNAVSTLQVQPVYMILPLFVSMVFGGGIEEFGWRGVMVGNLKKFNPFWIAIGIGFIWSLWHLPLFFLQGVNQYQANYPAFVLGVLGLSFALTAIYKKTESVIPCIILHAMINALGGLGLTYANDQTLAVWIDGFARLAIGVAAFTVVVKYPSKARAAA